MNKKILIIGGVSLILIVVGIWVYLLLSGNTSKTDGTFAEFGDGGESTDVYIPPNDDFDTFTEPIEQRLRQLTFRPVAGAVFVETGILYVEQGTGHVFNINLTTGNETLVSGTTLPKTRSAVFSKDGTYVAITNYISGVAETIIGSISPTGSLEGVSLPQNASEISFSTNYNEVLYYLVKNPGGSRGYLYDIEKAEASELFNLPLRDIRVIWGEDIYVYTTPTSQQEGYAYEVVENELVYLTEGNAGLVAFGTKEGPMITKVGSSNLAAKLIKKNDGVIFGALIPEKCSSHTSGTVCAIPETITKNTFPDPWYKGSVSFTDILWSVDIEKGVSTVLSNLLTESGREIDVIKIGADATGERFYFINKNDNSLWLFDTTIPGPQ